ncbi:MAG: hypothetical protein QM785_03880 [Pyrinomonadaceae bacterium]
MARETRACRYCTSANVVTNVHCRRCHRWLGPHDAANVAQKSSHRRFTRWQRNLAVTAVAGVIAFGSPYIYSKLDGDSTTELAAPKPAPARPLPDTSLRFDTSSNDREQPVNGKTESERKQNTQIASRKR